MYLLFFQKISKSIMAPMVSVEKREANLPKIDKNMIEKKNKLNKLIKNIEKNFEYVGKDIIKKVREIYYDKKNNNSIYGTTTDQERQDLEEEVIDLISVPWLDKEN